MGEPQEQRASGVWGAVFPQHLCRLLEMSGLELRFLTILSGKIPAPGTWRECV